MGVKTGAGGLNLLGRDVGRSDTKLGQMAQTLAKAKSTGSGIGGLLGGIIGQILIPIPGVGAAIGAGLGSLAGSKIGGATSGVSQGDILNTKFRKESAHNITKQVAQQEFANVAKSTLSGYMQGISPTSGLSGFESGWDAAGATGGSRLLGGIKGYGQSFLGKKSAEGLTEQTIRNAPGGPQGGMMVDGQWMGSAAPPGTVMSDLMPGGDSFINAAKAGDIMGDATMTDIPGLVDKSSNPKSLLGMGVEGDKSFAFTAPQSTEDVRQNAMSSLGINLPGSDDIGDWQMGEDGREWSPSLGQYKDSIRDYR